MSNLLDADFGSESEDDNFNPAPAVGSDDEVPGDSDNEVTVNAHTNGNKTSRQPKNSDADEPIVEQSGGAINNGTNGTNGDADDDGNDLEADGLDDIDNGIDDEDEDEEDDEDDEEEGAVTVSLSRNSSRVCT